MWIKDDTVKDIKKLVELTCRTALNARGIKPYNVLQLTHSGRTSKDKDWNPIPLVAFNNPYIDKYYPNITVATDERLEQLEEEVVKAAELAAEAGFDSVDIKICHNYIMRELLSAFTRPGKYGGSFENRTRFLFNVIDMIQKRMDGAIDICVRLNAYDSIPYPYGWGMVKEEGVMKPDLTEPKQLVRMLVDKGVKLINISTMMPRYQPYGKGMLAAYEPGSEIHPYQGTFYLLDATREIKQAVPDAVIVSTGLSWFEQFGANVGAGGIEQGWFDIAGFGRQGFAYPDFAADILDRGKMEHSKCCVTCDKCYELIDLHVESGCVARGLEGLSAYLQARFRDESKEVKRVNLSGTDLTVSALCLGSLNFGTLLSERQSHEQMSRFLDLGGNFIDTAHVYNDWIPGELSRSEKIIGRWLKASGKRGRIVLATKGAHPSMAARSVKRVRPEAIIEDMNASLANLNTDFVDIFFLHRDDPAVPVAEILGCLNEQIRQKKIRYIGCSNWSLKRIVEAQEYAEKHGLHGFVCNQLMWSLARINQAKLPDKYAVMDEPTYAYHSSTGLNAMCFSSQAKGYFTRRFNGEVLPKDVSDVYDNPANNEIFARLIAVSKETDTPFPSSRSAASRGGNSRPCR